MNDPIVIVSAARTPIGGLLGDFSSLQAHQLGAVAIKAAVERAGIAGDAVDEALMGCCLMAGQGQAPARQAVLGAGLPQSVGAVTLSKMCGSGMRAMMFAHDMLAAGSARRGRRRRHGEHDQRAAPDGQRAQGLSVWRGNDIRSHGARRARRCVSTRQGDGRVRRRLRREILLHARAAGRVCDRVNRTRDQGEQRRQLRVGDRTGLGRQQGRQR